MKTYLVGGAVRDQLLNLPVVDRDWVVVGATEEEMLELGFRRVPSGFPVFIHPETGDEYALARRETKTAPGYRGFAVESGPEVTLEQDLERRDLTINALALDSDRGELIDLFDGRRDLDDGVLRHITPAFVEDPVRLLRVARFAARLGRWGFRLSHGTFKLMKRMATPVELETLPTERVWSEMKQALGEEQPWRFFEVLQNCGALGILLPQLSQMMAPPGGHGSAVISQPMSSLKRLSPTADAPTRFAVVMYGAATLAEGGEDFVHGLRAEREFLDMLELLIREADLYRSLSREDPSLLLRLIERTRALQETQRFESFLTACQALWPTQHQQLPRLLTAAVKAVRSVSGARLAQQGYSGRELARRLRRQRLTAIQNQIKALSA